MAIGKKRLDMRKYNVCGVKFTGNYPELPPCDFTPKSYKGPDYDAVQNIRQGRLVPCITSYYKKPVLIHQGKMQWLWDHTGKRYLDMFGGIVTVSVGHCHPKVNAALADQMDSLWHTTNIYMHPKIHEYAQRLTDKMPGDLKVVYFVNSGSEATDLAMMMARLHTGHHDILSFRNAYHGMGTAAMGITAHSTWRYTIPVSQAVHHVMNPDPYQGIWGGAHCRDSPVQTDRKCDCDIDHCRAGDLYYKQLKEVFKYSLPRGRVAAFFAESIQGVGGTVQYPKKYLKRAHALVKANGGLYVADEVQTGFGRTGTHFWGFEGHGVQPDIVTMAKGIGNGFPLAAVVTTKEIASCLTQALHFNTYGGNPLACATGLAVLDVLEEEKLQQNALETGTYLLEGLAGLRDRYKCVGDVRGKGLMIGVELVDGRKSRTPMSAPHFVDIWEHCKDMGLLLGRGGLNANVLRIKPPMCITKADVDFTVAVLDKALRTHAVKTKRSANH
ncbi:alanine--glyoxylate aminotransferase 2, mitochondrial-like [Ctenocephalides felis]|uniref:alanine--glyoxylate aminotransferase 2, mitochondrial-like n=1 Tax=Ctenocephalides felis TaxID=7515 RepID=UPI000E6E2225|nr:alanine--glyoxylate aminotransferase 2, mitochondrial-like [Ctenocephalides felis]